MWHTVLTGGRGGGMVGVGGASVWGGRREASRMLRRRQQYIVSAAGGQVLVAHGPRVSEEELARIRRELPSGSVVLPRDWAIDPEWQEASERHRGRGVDEGLVKSLESLEADVVAAAGQASLIPGLPLRASVVSVRTLGQWSGVLDDAVVRLREALRRPSESDGDET